MKILQRPNQKGSGCPPTNKERRAGASLVDSSRQGSAYEAQSDSKIKDQIWSSPGSAKADVERRLQVEEARKGFRSARPKLPELPQEKTVARRSKAMEIVRENELSDKVVVLHGRIEDVNIEEKVDVIISEWMGYMLLYESMLGSIIFARDKWLKSGGLILPSHASPYMAPVTNSQKYHDSIYFWRDVYGIKMSSMMPLAKQCAFMEPSVETISGENVLTWSTVVAQVDCYTIQAPELETISAAFKFTSMLHAPFQGFAFWFDVEFDGPVRQKPKKQATQSMDGSTQDANPSSKRKKPDVSIVLSTAPEDALTHWQQTLLYLFEPIELNKDQTIEGSVTMHIYLRASNMPGS